MPAALLRSRSPGRVLADVDFIIAVNRLMATLPRPAGQMGALSPRELAATDDAIHQGVSPEAFVEGVLAERMRALGVTGTITAPARSLEPLEILSAHPYEFGTQYVLSARTTRRHTRFVMQEVEGR